MKTIHVHLHRPSRDQGRDEAYRGYFIQPDLTGRNFFIQRGGATISTKSSLEAAKKEIDNLIALGLNTDAELPRPKIAIREEELKKLGLSQPVVNFYLQREFGTERANAWITGGRRDSKDEML